MNFEAIYKIGDMAVSATVTGDHLRFEDGGSISVIDKYGIMVANFPAGSGVQPDQNIRWVRS